MSTYYARNKDRILEDKKQWYQNKNEYIICDCGIQVCKFYRSQHIKKKIHRDNLTKKIEKENLLNIINSFLNKKI